MIDVPNYQLTKRLQGQGFTCISSLVASNMQAYLFEKGTERKIVLVQFGIPELFKERNDSNIAETT